MQEKRAIDFFPLAPEFICPCQLSPLKVIIFCYNSLGHDGTDYVAENKQADLPKGASVKIWDFVQRKSNYSLWDISEKAKGVLQKNPFACMSPFVLVAWLAQGELYQQISKAIFPQ